MTDSLRSLIADTLAAHGSELWSGFNAGWRCSCGAWAVEYGAGQKAALADHQRHVADAILAALDGHQP